MASILEDLETRYARRWVIRTDLVRGVAAYRRTTLTPEQLGTDGLNVIVASDLTDLCDKLAAQDTP